MGAHNYRSRRTRHGIGSFWGSGDLRKEITFEMKIYKISNKKVNAGSHLLLFMLVLVFYLQIEKSSIILMKIDFTFQQ